ncbi:hypothetical protein BC628DRAFT_1423200 [Trametes gibbosa]|nr:hypothetical protein BC628DRAFT_1423200 [Trametes gibbosa]
MSNNQEQKIPQDSELQTGTVLALPPPPSEEHVDKVAATGKQAFKFDSLGPVVVNKDGTLSRIANWESMTSVEKERTLRILVARNQVRLADQEKKEASVTNQEKLTISQIQ